MHGCVDACASVLQTRRVTDHRTTVACHAWPALGIRGRASLMACLRDNLAIRIPGVLTSEQCSAYLQGVYEARGEWTEAFGGEQYSLGRAWYTDLETDGARTYFADAAASNQRVERYLPGMQAWLLGLARDMLGGHVAFRRGWCGPGVHVFPAGEAVARLGGSVHFDTEGLASPHIEARKPALSMIVMLQTPENGGGTRVWDLEYDGCDEVQEPADDGGLVTYDPGDLTILNAYRLHQIQCFGGDKDRVSITAMVAELDPGEWEMWF